MLGALHSIIAGSSSVASVVISIAFMLFFGFAMTRITKLLKLPNVTAYIIIGILLAIEFEYQDKPVINFYKKFFLILMIIIVICALILIFIPTKETIYAMCISEVITPNNIDAITEKGEKGVKFIFEQIEQLINNTAATS